MDDDGARPNRVDGRRVDSRLEKLFDDGLELGVLAKHVVEPKADWLVGRGDVLGRHHDHVIRLYHEDVLLLNLTAEVLALDELDDAPRPVHDDEAAVALCARAVAQLVDHESRHLVDQRVGERLDIVEAESSRAHGADGERACRMAVRSNALKRVGAEQSHQAVEGARSRFLREWRRAHSRVNPPRSEHGLSAFCFL